MPATISGLGSSSLLTLKLLFIRHFERCTVKPELQKIGQKNLGPANFSNFEEIAKTLIIDGELRGCRR